MVERSQMFFVVGCSRSGTTLLQHMLDAHPQIGVIPETRWFVRWYEKHSSLLPDDFVTPEFASLLAGSHRLFRDVDLALSEHELRKLAGSGRDVRYQDLVRFLFRRYGEVRGKPVVGNKTPGYVRRLQALHTLWPEAKFVHIIRDGREVSLSFIEKRAKKGRVGNPAGRFATWVEDPMTTSALWWEWNVRLGREAGRAIGPEQYHELRYEALVGDAETECVAICDFLGVPFDGAMLRHHQGRVKSDSRLSAKHPSLLLPISRGLRDWRTAMRAEDVERFESAGAGLLQELGYPLGAEMLPPSAMQHAARLRRLFKGRPLPQGWGDGLAASSQGPRHQRVSVVNEELD